MIYKTTLRKVLFVEMQKQKRAENGFIEATRK